MKEEGAVSKVGVVLLVVLVLAVGIYWLSRPPEKPPDVTVWHSFLEGEKRVAENAIKNSFSQKYPNITIDFKEITELRTRLLAAIPAGKGPDVFTWAHDWTGEFAAAGYIEALDNFVTPELLAKFTPTAIEAVTFDNKIWALPYAGETVALIYNKAMVQKPPETMTELVAAMENARAQGLYGIAYPIDPYFVSAFVHAFGGWYWDDETKTVGLNSEGTIRGLKYLIETFKPYMAEDPQAQVGIFLENMAPFIITGPWAVPSIEDAGIDYGIVPLPKIPEIDRWPEPFTGVKVMWMSSGARNKEKAFAFMEWFVTDVNHIVERARTARFIPVLKEALEVEEIATDPFITSFSEAIERGRPMPRGPEMMLVWGPFGDALMEAWLEPDRLEEVFNQAQMEAQRKIAEIYPR